MSCSPFLDEMKTESAPCEHAPRSVDPTGQHQLLGHDWQATDFWHQFPFYDVPSDVGADRYGDPVPLGADAAWCVAAGSDLQLQCEQQQVRDDTRPHWKQPLRDRAQWLVRAYDSSGNGLSVLGQFCSSGEALAALPTLLTVAHMLYPSFLLMARDAERQFKETTAAVDGRRINA